MNRAYSILDVKSVGEGGRRFAGIATTPTVDRVNDTINPLGAKFASEIPLLHGHRHDAPIGHVRLGKPTKAGIPFEAVIPVIHEPPSLKDRVDVAAAEIEHGLVKAVSVGFRPLSSPTFNDKGGVDFSEIEIYELSTVTIPANSEALISVVKSYDDAAREAAGVEDEPLPEIPANPPEQDATVRTLPVVKLASARDRAPFVIKKIHPERKRA
jgi:HK97 family phage prohead protease